MGTTTDNLASAVLEMRSTQLVQYFSAMGLVILLYDILLTTEDEVWLVLSRLRAAPSIYFLWKIRLVWPGVVNVPKVLYYINRYLAAASLLFCNYGE